MSSEHYKIIVDDQLKDKLERDGILFEHISKVIERAEKHEYKIISGENNNFISYLQIGTVTFWVQYTKLNDSYLIQNAYCHRIQIMEGN